MLNLFKSQRSPSEQPVMGRKLLADAYLRGHGIEIGALHQPLPVPPAANVTYVDRMSVPDLRTHYPELAEGDIVSPDVIDDGETLSKFEEASQDFIIANHFLEHCENPIQTIKNFYRVLNEGGVLFMAVPDKNFSFDKERPITPLEHLIRDYEEGPEWSRYPAYLEWARLVDKKVPPHDECQVQQYMKIKYSIHFHVWTEFEIFELLTYLVREHQLQMMIDAFWGGNGENVFIIRKGSAAAA